MGRVGEFVGSRLLLIGLLAGLLGFGLLVFVGIRVWLVITRGSLGPDVALLLVAGLLAFALLSIGRSATRTGFGYLHGQRTLSRDVGRFVSRRIERRRQTRGR